MDARLELEEARVQAGIEAGPLCLSVGIVLPVLEALAPRIKGWGRDAIPIGLGWVIGGIVDGVVDRILEALEEWRKDRCET